MPLAQLYKDRLGKATMGKNCIRIKRLADVPLEELRQAVLDAAAWSQIQERRYGRNCAQPVEE